MRSQRRLAAAISLLVVIPLGYTIRFSQGWFPAWMSDFLGSVAYEIAWILLVLMLFPEASPKWTAIAVFVATCGLEFLQLWRSPFWLELRATFLGRLILGNTFSWSDFPAYVAGSLAGWQWGRSL